MHLKTVVVKCPAAGEAWKFGEGTMSQNYEVSCLCCFVLIIFNSYEQKLNGCKRQLLNQATTDGNHYEFNQHMILCLPQSQLNETINYNERFSWEWTQGKPGFDEDAGRLNREYRAAQSKGLPYPILWAVEYFTVDEGNFRYGRYYRLAGWYCHIAM
ncbi:hypothetical protein AVEN_189124-1, partial [Araneus ventricosus]